MSYPQHARRALTLSVAITASLMAVVVLAQNKSQPLTNADIIQMVKEDVDESIILRAINTSEINFDISPSGLIQLKRGKVKSRIIQVIQDAQLKKNNARPAASPLGLAPTPSPAASPNTQPTPLPTPTPRLIPVAVQDAQFFTFELKRCSISGTSVACFLTITNNAQDRRLYLHPTSSRLIDSEGNEARGRYGKLANDEGGRVWRDLPGGISVESWIRFEGVMTSAQTISRLTISFYANPGGRFELEFRNIPLERSTKTVRTIGGSNVVLPETDSERRQRERKEEAERRKRERALNDILNKVRRRRF